MTKRPRVLVVCYSRSGLTRRVADAIAARLGCDVEELVDAVDRRGLFGYFRAGFDAFFGRATSLVPIRHDPREYDVIIVGTPVWDRSLPPAPRTYLLEHQSDFRQVAFFCTEERFGAGRVFRQMTAACGRAPLAVLAIHRDEFARSGVMAEIREFASDVVRMQEAA